MSNNIPNVTILCVNLLFTRLLTWLFEYSRKTAKWRWLRSWFFRQEPTTSMWSRCVDRPLRSSSGRRL